MKQRLLLSLLMLMVSVGLVKAAVKITIPKGETATLTVTVIPNTDAPAVTIGTATKPAHTFNASGSYTVPKDDKAAQEIEISNTFSALTITGKATVLRVGNKAIETIIASGIGLETLEIVYADGLKTLNVSNNALTSIDVSKATALETLNVSENEISNLGMLPQSLKDLNIASNGFSISSPTWDLTTALPKLEKLDISENKLLNVTVPTTCTSFMKGTQDLTEKSATAVTVAANKNLDINTLATTHGFGGQPMKAASDWKKQSGTSWVSASNEAHTIGTGNNVIYRFYDSSNNNVYTDGTYECVVERNDGFKYRVRLTVTPAEFTTDWKDVPNGTLVVKNGNSTVGDGTTVKQGDVLSIGVEPATNYEFVQFKDANNLVLTNNSAWTKNPVECKVEGKFVSSSAENGVVSIAAETKGELAMINFTPTTDGGTMIIQQINEDGLLSAPFTKQTQVAYNTELQITLTPDLGYTTKLIINDNPMSIGQPNEKGQYVVEYTVTGNCEITAQFAKSTMVTLKGVINGVPLTTGQTFNAKQENNDGSISENGFQAVSGRSCQVTFTLGNTDVLKQVRLNQKDITESVTKVSGNTSNTYHFTFTPEEDVTIYVSTTAQQTITIKPEATEQEFVYDGKAKAFAFTTEPSGLESKVQITYKSDADATAKVDAPIRVDRYLPVFTVKDEFRDNYSIDAPNANDYRVVINKATPTITTAPKVTISSDKTEYVLSNDGKANVKGEFNLQNPTATVNNDEAHFVVVKFTPEDKDNYNEATVQVEVVPEGKDAMERMAVNLESTLPEGIESVSLLNNGTTTAKFGETFPKSVTLVVLVKYEEGVNPDDINVSTTLLSQAPLAEDDAYTDAASRIKAFKYQIPGGTQAETLDVQVSNAPTYTYSVVLKAVDAETYTGNPIAYDKSNITVTRDKDDANTTAISMDKVIVSYKLGNIAIEGNPVNAGEYTVCISIKAGDGYKAFYQEYTGKFSIDKATPKVASWPKVQPIAKGQKLKFAELVGGGSNEISGEFEWLSPESTPKNGDMCKVKFVPDDLTNYEEVTKDDGLMVTVTDLQLVTKYAKNGTITITDTKGNPYESGTPVTEGTVLKITATPDEDFELESLNITGATNNGNGTYTVGESSVEVEATFRVKVLPGNFRVSIPDANDIRGAIISNGGEHVVAQGGSLSFTVSTLAADADKVRVTAGGRTLSRGTNGRYTLSNVQANTTVSVSLSNPTEIEVDVPRTYLNKKDYHIGSVEIESDDDEFYYGDVITLIAFPESGVSFDKWSDGNKEQIRELTLTEDVALKAVFSGTPTGIEDIESARISTGHGFIQIKNVANADLTIVSIAGRIQTQQRISGDVQIRVPQGVYVVVLENDGNVQRTKVIVR